MSDYIYSFLHLFNYFLSLYHILGTMGCLVYGIRNGQDSASVFKESLANCAYNSCELNGNIQWVASPQGTQTMIKQYDKFLKDSVSEDTGVNHENSSRLEKVQIDREWSRQEDLTGRCVLIWTLKSEHHLDREEREGHLRQGKGNSKTLSWE